MAYVMTKQGSLDNCITYEFICDTISDMNAIENRYRTIGSIAIVLSGEGGGIEVYMAGSNRAWNDLGAMGGSSTTIDSRVTALEAEVENLKTALATLLVPTNTVTTENGDVLTDESGNTLEYDVTSA